MNRNIKKVYTVHDLIPIILPEYFSSPYNQLLVKEVVDNIELDDYVICVSESTKNDLMNYRTDLNNDKIVVSTLAASMNFNKVLDEKEINYIRDKYQIASDKKYLLSVCTLEPRKNIKTLLAAYRKLLQDHKIDDLLLVLTGVNGWESDVLTKEIQEINSQFSNSIILTGFIPDIDLAVLYSGAYVFVYPSFYEGFGLPVLEAMQCGVPVIASNTSSLSEIIGDCGILIDPMNKFDLGEAIFKLYNNLELRNKLAKKSIQRASHFSWHKVTGIILKVFKSATENNVREHISLQYF